MNKKTLTSLSAGLFLLLPGQSPAAGFLHTPPMEGVAMLGVISRPGGPLGTGQRRVLRAPGQEVREQAGAPLPRAMRVEFDQLPWGVRNTIMTQFDRNQIEEIMQGIVQGQRVYQVHYRDRQGQLNGLRLDEQGNFLARITPEELWRQGSPGLGRGAGEQVMRPGGFRPVPRGDGGGEARLWGGFALPLSDGTHVEWHQVPRGAQERIREISGGARIENITRGEWLGLTAYQAAFKQEGQHHEVRVAEDGYFLEESVEGQVRRQAPLVENRLAHLRGLPRPVQRAIQEEAGGAMIRNLEGQRWQGRLVYEAVLDLRGQAAQVVVSEDGQVLRGSGFHPAAGGPAEPQPGWGQGGPVTRKVTFEQLPLMVQQTVRTQVNLEEIEDIDERREAGRTRYEVGFKRQGQHLEMQVDADGRILSIGPANR
jgi:hypothetical protein